jgi:protein-tyrosine kinase
MSSIEKAMEKMKHRQVQNSQRVAQTPQTKQKVVQRHKLAEGDSGGRTCVLDTDFLEKNGYLTPEMKDEQLVEEYRAIKRPLLMQIAGKGAAIVQDANLIAVVSALPGEGKTYTAMNLAISMAMEKNTKVLLVDTDVVKPGLSVSLKLHDQKGLMDVLTDDSISVGDVIYKTNIAKLNIIPVGRQHRHASELLASQEMRELCQELSSRYPDRVIIFDAPPLLVTSQASLLAHLAGQVVFVVEAGKTLQHEITEAISQIDQEKIVGLVLNKSRRFFGGDYNYGTYGAVSQ